MRMKNIFSEWESRVDVRRILDGSGDEDGFEVVAGGSSGGIRPKDHNLLLLVVLVNH